MTSNHLRRMRQRERPDFALHGTNAYEATRTGIVEVAGVAPWERPNSLLGFQVENCEGLAGMS